MSWLKRLGALFAGGGSDAKREAYSLYYYVRCGRCREIIKARVDLANDLSVEYGDDGGATGYVYRKVLIGRNRCFQPLEVNMTFDARRKVVAREVNGGEFASEEEFAHAQPA